jgi:hypothetical protein
MIVLFLLLPKRQLLALQEEDAKILHGIDNIINLLKPNVLVKKLLIFSFTSEEINSENFKISQHQFLDSG